MASTVFITGASGLIGLHVGKAFKRQGYHVYGLVRSADKAKALLREEIVPVYGDLAKEETWKDAVVKSGIIVDTVNDPAGVSLNRRLVEVAIEASKAANRPKTVIYTSGLGVFGHRPGELIDENSPLTPSWRSDYDEWLIKQEGIHPVVIRPAAVYGASLGMWSILFDVGDVFEIRGKPEKRLPWIHVNDLAEMYYLAAKQPEKSSHQVFHGTTLDAPTWEEVRRAIAKYLGWTGKIEYTAPVTPFEKFVDEITMEATPKKAEEVLGWKAKYPPFLHSLDTTYKAYVAHKDQ